ncbi:hypothetical protein DMUE_5817 [Dictyocoela muelleri]|nr:hypothetical protein DMUE_5817 [Dictyocoela muelleri]
MVRPRKNPDKVNYNEITKYFTKKITIIQFLQSINLIPKSMKCKKCRSSMKLMKYKICTSKFSWRCKKPCYKRRSIYDSSFFQECRIDLLKFIQLVYLFFYKDIGPSEAIKELRISLTTYYYYKKKFEYVIYMDYLLNKPKIGGEGIEVQVDESLFNKRKYHKGRKKKQIWVFGGVESVSKKCFFRIVEARDKPTLQILIDINVKKGSEVVSDMWRAYIGLEEKGFLHFTVNHSKEWINKKTGKHTQKIENLWMIAKKKIHKDYGINANRLQMHLDKFAWEISLNRSFSVFLSLLNKK